VNRAVAKQRGSKLVQKQEAEDKKSQRRKGLEQSLGKLLLSCEPDNGQPWM
jgi:hypothetical protein